MRVVPRIFLGAVALVLWLAARGGSAAPAEVPIPAQRPSGGSAAQEETTRVFDPAKLREIDDAITRAISEQRCPGAVIWLERGGVAYHRSYGDRAVEPAPETMTEDTIFDAASLTKVIATTTAVMRLAERGKVDLEAKLSAYLPAFSGDGKEQITIRQLLTHTSGLPSGLGFWLSGTALERASSLKLSDPPGAVFRYSDVNFILLGLLVEQVSGQPLDTYCTEHIFQPLAMRSTGFHPTSLLADRIAPTTRETPRGTVHDPTARRMGGVAGHAGLFTTAADLARFARMLLGRGSLEGVQILDPETVQQMTSVQTPEPVPARRGFGWDIDSPYAGPRGERFPIGSFGHSGWTGTSLWIDPFSGSFIILLTNRNHPTESGNVIALRKQIGTLAAEAIRDFDFAHVPGALPPRRAGP